MFALNLIRPSYNKRHLNYETSSIVMTEIDSHLSELNRVFRHVISLYKSKPACVREMGMLLNIFPI